MYYINASTLHTIYIDKSNLRREYRTSAIFTHDTAAHRQCWIAHVAHRIYVSRTTYSWIELNWTTTNNSYKEEGNGGTYYITHKAPYLVIGLLLFETPCKMAIDRELYVSMSYKFLLMLFFVTYPSSFDERTFICYYWCTIQRISSRR